MNTLRLGGLPATPFSVVCSFALIAFGLGFVLTVGSGSDGTPHFGVFLALSVIVLVLAGGAVGTAIRAILRDDLDIEIVLFLIPSAVLGALLFFLILGSYVLGLFVPYALALLDWNEEDTEMHWDGVMIILLIGAGLLALVLGAPVGIVAWASRFVGPRQT